jgi:carotenoid cleavage dioxygenase-like enzyme
MTKDIQPHNHNLQFPDSITFNKFFHPMRVEADIYDAEVLGRVPDVLQGTYYRLGADAQYPPYLGADIYLNGDGMMTMMRLENGHADIRTRFVRTARFKAERAARRSLFGRYRNPYTDDPSVAGLDRGTANTSAFWFGGKLFALKEDNRPVEMDPHTLETVGTFDFGGTFTGKTFTAHPKVDPRTGNMIAYAYNSDELVSKFIYIYEISPDLKVIREERFEAPYSSMIHDFLVSENYICFTLYPMIADQTRVEAGGPFFSWDPAHKTVVAVIPRKEGVAGIRWFTSPKLCMETHTMNAWEEGDMLHLEHFISNSGWYSQFPHVSDPAPKEEPPFGQRWSFNMADPEDKFTVKALVPHPGEMPVVDPRFSGVYCRHIFFGAINTQLGPMLEWGPMGPPFNCLAHLDQQTGEITHFYPGPNASTEEPVFVPKSDDAPEGDGWLISVVGRRNENRSDIVIVDSMDLKAGAVATIQLPFRLRYAFHGCWATEEELAAVVGGVPVSA